MLFIEQVVSVVSSCLYDDERLRESANSSVSKIFRNSQVGACVHVSLTLRILGKDSSEALSFAASDDVQFRMREERTADLCSW